MNKTNDYNKTNLKAYQYLIEKLMYFSCNTRLDIVFTVGQLSKYNTDLRVGHLKETKRVVQYFRDTIYLEIMYGITEVNSKSYNLIEYANGNYDVVKRSTS